MRGRSNTRKDKSLIQRKRLSPSLIHKQTNNQRRTIGGDQPEENNLKGQLINTNSTCFLNATVRLLQGLSLITGPFKKTDKTTKRARAVIEAIEELNENKSINLKKMQDEYWKEFPLNAYDDAADVARKLVEELQIECPTITESKSCGNRGCRREITKKEYKSYITKLQTTPGTKSISNLLTTLKNHDRVKVDYTYTREDGPAGRCQICKNNEEVVMDQKLDLTSKPPKVIIFEINKRANESIKMGKTQIINGKVYRLHSWLMYKNNHYTVSIARSGTSHTKYMEYDDLSKHPRECFPEDVKKCMRMVCYVEDKKMNHQNKPSLKTNRQTNDRKPSTEQNEEHKKKKGNEEEKHKKERPEWKTLLEAQNKEHKEEANRTREEIQNLTEKIASLLEILTKTGIVAPTTDTVQSANQQTTQPLEKNRKTTKEKIQNLNNIVTSLHKTLAKASTVPPTKDTLRSVSMHKMPPQTTESSNIQEDLQSPTTDFCKGISVFPTPVESNPPSETNTAIQKVKEYLTSLTNNDDEILEETRELMLENSQSQNSEGTERSSMTETLKSQSLATSIQDSIEFVGNEIPGEIQSELMLENSQSQNSEGTERSSMTEFLQSQSLATGIQDSIEFIGNETLEETQNELMLENSQSQNSEGTERSSTTEILQSQSLATGIQDSIEFVRMYQQHNQSVMDDVFEIIDSWHPSVDESIVESQQAETDNECYHESTPSLTITLPTEATETHRMISKYGKETRESVQINKSTTVTSYSCTACISTNPKAGPLYEDDPEDKYRNGKGPDMRCGRFVAHVIQHHPHQTQAPINLKKDNIITVEIDRERLTW